jgi:hypothetical protein
MEKTKQEKSIVKINAPIHVKSGWTKSAKEKGMNRSEYLLDLIENNSKPRKFFSLETILNKITKK